MEQSIVDLVGQQYKSKIKNGCASLDAERPRVFPSFFLKKAKKIGRWYITRNLEKKTARIYSRVWLTLILMRIN